MTIRTVAMVGLIVLAALTRLLPHPPNFAPITGIAVFGAIRFGSRRATVLVPLGALLLSDLAREVLYRYGFAQEWGVYRGMWVVYGTTALIALMCRIAHGTRRPTRIATATLAGSCLFYLVTNFAVWAGGTFYPTSVEGLVECYAAALPFFRNSLLGDATYSVILFGTWALAEARLPSLRLASTHENPS
jgi:hypothetical protein